MPFASRASMRFTAPYTPSVPQNILPGARGAEQMTNVTGSVAWAEHPSLFGEVLGSIGTPPRQTFAGLEALTGLSSHGPQLDHSQD